MNQVNWLVKKASTEDIFRWFEFASSVSKDFYNIDLAKDKKYHDGMIKNINRSTAIYVEDASKEYSPIIGAMTYSPNQKHISWLAVHQSYRNTGIASALMTYMLKEMADAREIKVKTFHTDDEYGIAARNFYKKHGFVAGETLIDDEYPHPVQVFTKKYMTIDRLRIIAAEKVNPRKLSDKCYVASVASALETDKGNIYVGVCIDTPSSMGFCAEHSAIAQMITNGESRIVKIVAIGREGRVLPPCGRCREFIYQIDKENLSAEVLIGDNEIVTIKELLPYR